MKDSLEIIGILTLWVLAVWCLGYVLAMGFETRLCVVKIDDNYKTRITHPDGTPVEFVTRCKK